MPEIGDTKKGIEVGFKTHSKVIWAACLDCGKERWVQAFHKQPKNDRCGSCSQLVKTGGRLVDPDGYISIYLKPDDFFFSMAQSKTKYGGYVPEHRLVMAKHLGRCLQPWEKVHHKDGIRDHNEYSNLKMSTAGSHILEHSKGYRDGYAKGLIDGRNKQIQQLKAQNEELLMLLEKGGQR